MRALVHKLNQDKLPSKFLKLWKDLDGPPLVPEFRFHSKRRWRLDFAEPRTKIGIELEGGIYAGSPCPFCKMRRGGRHNQGKGFENDCEKYWFATMDGWRIFRLTPGMITFNFVNPIIFKIQREKHG